MKREQLIKKDNQLYILLASPKLVEWAFFLFAKDSEQKGVKVYTTKGKYTKRFLSTVTHENVMPYLRIICGSYNQKDYTKQGLLNIDRKINPRKYNTHYMTFRRGLTELTTSFQYIKWMNNADINFYSNYPVYFKKRRFVYVGIDEYKPTNIIDLFR